MDLKYLLNRVQGLLRTEKQRVESLPYMPGHWRLVDGNSESRQTSFVSRTIAEVAVCTARFLLNFLLLHVKCQ